MSATEACIWFNIAATAGLGPAAVRKVAVYLERNAMPVEDLVGIDADVLREAVGLSDGVAYALHMQLEHPTDLPDVPAGVELLTPADERYPFGRLMTANPPLTPVLWAVGEVSLLGHRGPSLAISGSRAASPEVLETVYAIAKEASSRGWMVVSGLADGVDSAAHSGAMAGRSGTIGVLASGLADGSHRWSPDDPDGLCIVSEFPLRAPWSGQRAMQRNATIAALADRVLVAASGAAGGSWEMGQMCLRRRKDLFVLDLSPEEGPGNGDLIGSGAIAVDPGYPDQLLGELDGPMSLFP